MSNIWNKKIDYNNSGFLIFQTGTQYGQYFMYAGFLPEMSITKIDSFQDLQINQENRACRSYSFPMLDIIIKEYHSLPLNVETSPTIFSPLFG